MQQIPFPDEFSGYACAAALIGLGTWFNGASIVGPSLDRAIFELEKFAPAYVEPPGAQLLASAGALVHRQVAGYGAQRDVLIEVAVMHGSRLLRRRGRRVQDFTLAAMARVAATATGGTLTPSFHEVAHAVRVRSEGEMSVDDGPTRYQVASDEIQLAKACGVDLFQMIKPPEPDRLRARLELVAGPLCPWPPRASDAEALANLLVLATVADSPEDQARQLLTQEAEALDTFLRLVPGADPSVAANGVLERFPSAVRADSWVVLRMVEEYAGLLAHWPQDRQDVVFKAVNHLAQSADLSMVRREIVTMTMAVFALGKQAQWRPRKRPC